MKLIIEKNRLNIIPEQFLRRAGYGYIRDRRTGAESFVRRLGSGFYPRLHMYAEEQSDKIVFNLHLDQKQPSYAGAPAHNAEYEGEIVEAEMERIKELISRNVERGTGNMEHVIHNMKQKTQEKKSWWKFW